MNLIINLHIKIVTEIIWVFPVFCIEQRTVLCAGRKFFHMLARLQGPLPEQLLYSYTHGAMETALPVSEDYVRLLLTDNINGGIYRFPVVL